MPVRPQADAGGGLAGRATYQGASSDRPPAAVVGSASGLILYILHLLRRHCGHRPWWRSHQLRTSLLRACCGQKEGRPGACLRPPPPAACPARCPLCLLPYPRLSPVAPCRRRAAFHRSLAPHSRDARAEPRAILHSHHLLHQCTTFTRRDVQRLGSRNRARSSPLSTWTSPPKRHPIARFDSHLTPLYTSRAPPHPHRLRAGAKQRLLRLRHSPTSLEPLAK
jgi:hypothetical protein